jgi:UPF0176 protein
VQLAKQRGEAHIGSDVKQVIDARRQQKEAQRKTQEKANSKG